MKIKLFALMFGIIHGAKMEIVQQGNGVKGSFLSKLYNFKELWSGQPVDEEGNPLSITEVLEKYYVAEVRIQKLVVEINFITIIKSENGLIICIFLKHKGPCPTSQFPFPMSGDGEQNANLYLESTDIQLDYFASYISILLPLTVRPGQYDYVNLETITELCEELISYLTRSGSPVSASIVEKILYKIDAYKLSPIDFIRKYPHDLTEIEINVIKRSSIANEVKSFYEFMILTTAAFDINVHNLRAHSLLNSTIKSHTQRLIEIYFDDIEKQTEKINISDKYNKIIEEFIEEQEIDDNGNGVSYFEDILNKVNAGKASNEDKEIITAFWETCDIKNITNTVKMYFVIKAFWKKYNIDDNGSGLTRMKNKILDIFYGIEIAMGNRTVTAQTKCKETIDILRLIKDYAWLDAEIYKKTHKISDFSSGLPGIVAELRALTDQLPQ